MAFRQYSRVSGGLEAGVQQVLYGLTILTAPIWIPVLALVILFGPGSAPNKCSALKAQYADVVTRISAERDADKRAPLWEERAGIVAQQRKEQCQ